MKDKKPLTIKEGIRLRDIVAISKDVREADLKEWSLAWTSSLSSVEFDLYTAILVCANRSDRCWTVYEGDRAVMTFGVSPGGQSYYEGSAWLIATNAAQRRAATIHRAFFQESIRQMYQSYQQIKATVWSGNKVHVYWLMRSGFTASTRDPEFTVPVGAPPFVVFERGPFAANRRPRHVL